jgi:TRAP-type mannitol/chloroaromatic compound transport system permease small subunit
MSADTGPSADSGPADDPPAAGGIGYLAAGMSLLGTAFVVAILLVINTDIVGRELFGRPLRGATEMVSIGIVVVVFMSLPHTILAGRMVRVDLFSSWFRQRAPRLGAWVAALFNLTGAVLMLLMTWALAPEVRRAWELDDYVGSLGDFTVPIWPVRALQCLSAGVTTVAFVMLALRELRRGAHPDPRQ